MILFVTKEQLQHIITVAVKDALKAERPVIKRSDIDRTLDAHCVHFLPSNAIITEDTEVRGGKYGSTEELK